MSDYNTLVAALSAKQEITSSLIDSAKEKVADAYTIVVSKGGTVPSLTQQTLMDGALADAIDTIPTVSGDLGKVLDGSITTISSDVTTLRPYAFADCFELTSVSLPNATELEMRGFYNCYNLTEFDIPDTVTLIDSSCFEKCSRLPITTLPSSLVTIGSYAFYMCNGITGLTLPSGVTKIGNNAFDLCENMEYLDVSELASVPTIMSTTFSNTTFPFLFRDFEQMDAFAAATNWSALLDRFQLKED